MEEGEEPVTSSLKQKTVLMLKEDLRETQEKFNSEDAYVEGNLLLNS